MPEGSSRTRPSMMERSGRLVYSGSGPNTGAFGGRGLEAAPEHFCARRARAHDNLSAVRKMQVTNNRRKPGRRRRLLGLLPRPDRRSRERDRAAPDSRSADCSSVIAERSRTPGSQHLSSACQESRTRYRSAAWHLDVRSTGPGRWARISTSIAPDCSVCYDRRASRRRAASPGCAHFCGNRRMGRRHDL
jgi:hypothetical protein